MELSKRVNSVVASPTLAITAKANELRAEGFNVIGLGAGEPDFNTPAYIRDAAKRAMESGYTKYTPTSGITELKEAIMQKFQKDNTLEYGLDEIIVTMGAKHGLFALFQVLLNEGDEVIIPAPYWVSYPEQVRLADGIPLILPTEETNDFKITPKELENTITDKTKAIIINSPSNPTGVIYSQKELEEIGEICLKHNILIVSDEIYEKLNYTEEPHVSIASISPALKNQTMVVNGLSKSHAMTGWRIGYVAGNKAIIKAMSDIGSHSTSNPTSISQYAALAAYKADEANVIEMKDIFAERLDIFYDLISDIPGINCIKPKGAFYLFPNVMEAAKKNGFKTVDEWVKAILEDEKVAMVPGSGFGSPSNVRLSYALSLEDLIEAAKRIKRFVENHS